MNNITINIYGNVYVVHFDDDIKEYIGFNSNFGRFELHTSRLKIVKIINNNNQVIYEWIVSLEHDVMLL